MINRRYKELQLMRRQSQGNRVAEREGSRSRRRTADPALERKLQDFGFMTTDAQAVEVRKALEESKHSDAHSQLSDAEKKLRAFEGKNIKDIDALWGQARNDFTTVGIYNKEKLEGTYRIPKSVMEQLNGGEGGTLNSGDGSYTGRWKGDNRYNIDVTVRGLDEARGKELHEMFHSAESDVKTQFYEKYAKQVNDNNARVKSEAENARSQIEGQRGVLDADTQLTADALARHQQQYQETKAKSRATAQSMGYGD